MAQLSHKKTTHWMSVFELVDQLQNLPAGDLSHILCCLTTFIPTTFIVPLFELVETTAELEN